MNIVQCAAGLQYNQQVVAASDDCTLVAQGWYDQGLIT